jgi:hypothetical protein
VYGDDTGYAKADLVSAGGNRVLEFLRETDLHPGLHDLRPGRQRDAVRGDRECAEERGDDDD